jgi:hypothetical protein
VRPNHAGSSSQLLRAQGGPDPGRPGGEVAQPASLPELGLDPGLDSRRPWSWLGGGQHRQRRPPGQVGAERRPARAGSPAAAPATRSSAGPATESSSDGLGAATLDMLGDLGVPEREAVMGLGPVVANEQHPCLLTLTNTYVEPRRRRAYDLMDQCSADTTSTPGLPHQPPVARSSHRPQQRPVESSAHRQPARTTASSHSLPLQPH